MASTVFANGKAVATAASDHVAHVSAPDFRLVEYKTPCGLWNEIDSAHIARQYPQLTVFDSAKIWTSPVEVGDPPKSLPADNWPGVANGGKINSFAAAAPGQGSANVYVEGNKVLRHLDITKQNAGNSPGLINDQAGAAEARKNFKPVIPDEKGAPAKGAKSGSKGAADGDDVKSAPAGTPPRKEQEQPQVAPDKCTLLAVELTKDDRRQDAPKEADKALLEVVGTSPVTLTATLAKGCGKHPAWSGTGVGSLGTGSTISYTPPGSAWSASSQSSGRSATQAGLNVALDLRGMYQLATASPQVLNVTADATPHEGNKSREVRVFPTDKFDSQYEPFNAWQSGTTRFLNFLGKTLALGYIEWEVGKGSFSLKAEWKEERNSYRAYWYGSINGTLTVFKVSWNKHWDFAEWPIPIPAVKLAQLTYVGINKLYKRFAGHDLADLYVKFSIGFQLDVSAGFGVKRYHGGTYGWSGTGSITGTGNFTVSGNLDIDKDVFNISIGIGIEIKVEGEAIFDAHPVKLPIVLKPASLKGSITIKWDLTKLLQEELSDSLLGWMFGSRVTDWVEAFSNQLKGSRTLDASADLTFLWSEIKLHEFTFGS